MKTSILCLVSLLSSSTLFGAALAATVTASGYVVDVYCWNDKDHMGAGGSKLTEAPEKPCMLDPTCMNSGFLLLEKKTGATEYSVKYTLDSAGNAKVVDLLKASKKTAGVKVEVTGDDDGKGNIKVTSAKEVAADTGSGSTDKDNEASCGVLPVFGGAVGVLVAAVAF